MEQASNRTANQPTLGSYSQNYPLPHFHHYCNKAHIQIYLYAYYKSK